MTHTLNGILAFWGCKMMSNKISDKCDHFRFKNLVQQYQSMYPALTVDAEDQLKKLKV